MNNMSNIRRDFIASHLRSQFRRLSSILDNIEEEAKVDCDYTHESLKRNRNQLASDMETL